MKNSFQGISPTKFVRKLLNVRSPQAPKFTGITALVPFSTATGHYTHDSGLAGLGSGGITGQPDVEKQQGGCAATMILPGETEAGTAGMQPC
ncbi:MAG: hypothetical protein ACLPW4_11290 [Candidatus Sulfotelmatobacter sp.]